MSITVYFNNELILRGNTVRGGGGGRGLWFQKVEYSTVFLFEKSCRLLQL